MDEIFKANSAILTLGPAAQVRAGAGVPGGVREELGFYGITMDS